MRDLLGRPWRGYARELRSYLEEARVMSEAGVLDAVPFRHDAPAERVAEDDRPLVPLQAMIEEAERTHIRRALDRTGRSISTTADLLGISRKTLWEKMKRLGISG